MTKGLVIIADYSQETTLTAQELCEICQVSSDFIHDLIVYEILDPNRHQSNDLGEFSLSELRRIKRVLRLQHDLEVNLAGAAVVLDLLERLENAHSRLTILERHLR